LQPFFAPTPVVVVAGCFVLCEGAFFCANLAPTPRPSVGEVVVVVDFTVVLGVSVVVVDGGCVVVVAFGTVVVVDFSGGTVVLAS